MADFDPLDVSVLQTARQRRRQIQIAEELKALGTLVDDFQLMILVQLVLVGFDCARALVRVLQRGRVVGVQGQVVALDQLRRDLANLEAFKQRDEPEVDAHRGAENDGLAGRADRVFDLVRPNVLDGLV